MGENKKNQPAYDHSQHRSRLKNRFIETGLNSFEEHNILEMLLFYSVPRRDTNETAHRLINEFGSLAGVFDAPFEALMNVPGVGRESATLIKFIPDVCRKYYDSNTKNQKLILSPEDARAFLEPKFIGYQEEILYLVCLDGRGAIKKASIISTGSKSDVSANINKIFAEVINTHAAGIILAHNHPHGFAVPSADDIRLTERISAMLADIESVICDHLIFSRDDVCFMSRLRNIKPGTLGY